MNMEFMAKALKNIRDVEYEGMDSAYFNTFIALVKKDPNVKTRYISTEYGIILHQDRLEKALTENPHIQFHPHRNPSRMLGWTDTFEKEGSEGKDDYDPYLSQLLGQMWQQGLIRSYY